MYQNMYKISLNELKHRILKSKSSSLKRFEMQNSEKRKTIDNVTELNKVIYAGAKLVCDRIGVPLRNRNTKGIRLEGQVKKL